MKKRIVAIIIFIIGILIIGFGICKFNDPNDKIYNDYQDENYNYKHSLTKFVDYDSKEIIYNHDFDYDDGYYILRSFNKNKNVEKFNVYKDEKSVFKAELSKDFDDLEYIGNGVFIAKKNNKYGLLDKTGKEILEIKYTNIEADRENKNYLHVVNDSKTGICDIKGTVIVPIEYDELVSNTTGYFVIDDNNKQYFVLLKNNVYYAIDQFNNILFSNKKKIEFETNLSKFVIKNKINDKVKSLDYYSLDGKFLKKIEIEDKYIYEKEGYLYQSASNNFILLVNQDDIGNVYVINKDLEIKKINNVYYENVALSAILHYYYYTFDDFYGLKNNDKYELRLYEDNKKIGEDYYFIEHFRKLILCKDSNKTCAFVDMDDIVSNSKIDYSYEYIDNDLYTNYFKKGNEYFFPSKSENILTCEEDFDFSGFDGNPYVYINKSNLFLASNNGLYLYDTNCKKITDKPIETVYEESNGVVVASYDCKFNNEENINMCKYYILDNDNKLIKFNNKDNVEILDYIGYANNALLFQTNKGIYKIEL